MVLQPASPRDVVAYDLRFGLGNPPDYFSLQNLLSSVFDAQEHITHRRLIDDNSFGISNGTCGNRSDSNRDFFIAVFFLVLAGAEVRSRS